MDDETYVAIKVAVECAANCLARAQDNLGCRVDAWANLAYLKRQLDMARDYAGTALMMAVGASDPAVPEDWPYNVASYDEYRPNK